MSTSVGLFSSSLGRKILMAITGLFLCSFLIVHLVGNLALFYSPDDFNMYTRFMSTNGMIRIAEIILFLGIIVHAVDAVMLTRANRKARPVKYAMDKKRSTWVSRNMGITGSLVLAFIIIHLNTFLVTYKFGEVGQVMIEGEQVKDMYDVVVKAFGIKYYSAGYVIALLILGMHLNHGFQSAFQSLGLNHKRYTPGIKMAGKLFAILITIGFVAFPIYFGFIK